MTFFVFLFLLKHCYDVARRECLHVLLLFSVFAMGHRHLTTRQLITAI